MTLPGLCESFVDLLPPIILRYIALHEQMGETWKARMHTLISNTSFSQCHSSIYPSYISSGGKEVDEAGARYSRGGEGLRCSFTALSGSRHLDCSHLGTGTGPLGNNGPQGEDVSSENEGMRFERLRQGGPVE